MRHPTLHTSVREDIHKKVTEDARKNCRSISGQISWILEVFYSDGKEIPKIISRNKVI